MIVLDKELEGSWFKAYVGPLRKAHNHNMLRVCTNAESINTNDTFRQSVHVQRLLRVNIMKGARLIIYLLYRIKPQRLIYSQTTESEN